VTRLRYLGDVILSTPLVQVLRELFPESRLDYLVEAAFAPALENCPALNQVHVLEAHASTGETWSLVRRLRAVGYDWALDLFGNPRSALLCLLSGAHRRVGSRRGLRSRLYHHRRGRPEGDPSAILHHLDKATPLLRQAGIAWNAPTPPPRIWLREEERRSGRDIVGSSGAAILLHPGSKWPDKAWPASRWSELAVALRERRRGEVLVVSPPGEDEQAHRIAEEAGGLRVLPPLGLRALFGVLSQAGLYVGNDGGILHAAVALGTPSLGLFGPTEPEIWFPYEKLGPYRVLHSCAAAEAGCKVKSEQRLLVVVHVTLRTGADR